MTIGPVASSATLRRPGRRSASSSGSSSASAIGVFGGTWAVRPVHPGRARRGPRLDRRLRVVPAGRGRASPCRLLIGELAFGIGSERDDHVKLAVLVGSVSSPPLLATVVLRVRNRHYRLVEAARPRTTTPTAFPTSTESRPGDRLRGGPACSARCASRVRTAQYGRPAHARRRPDDHRPRRDPTGCRTTFGTRRNARSGQLVAQVVDDLAPSSAPRSSWPRPRSPPSSGCREGAGMLAAAGVSRSTGSGYCSSRCRWCIAIWLPVWAELPHRRRGPVHRHRCPGPARRNAAQPGEPAPGPSDRPGAGDHGRGAGFGVRRPEHAKAGPGAQRPGRARPAADASSSWVATRRDRRAADARVTSVTLDAAFVLLDGPWEHRLVSANGARFHVAELGDGPMVLLMHGFPQFWYTWRHQMAAIADAGWRVGRDGPARLRRERQAAARLQHLHRRGGRGVPHPVARRGRRHRRRPGPRRVHRVVHAVPPARRGPRRRVAVDAAPADHAARVGTRPAAAAGQPVPRRAAAARSCPSAR